MFDLLNIYGCEMSGKSQGKFKSLKDVNKRVNIEVFPSTFIVFLHSKFFCTFYGHELCCIGRIFFMKLNDKLNPFCMLWSGTINSCTVHVTC